MARASSELPKTFNKGESENKHERCNKNDEDFEETARHVFPVVQSSLLKSGSFCLFSL